MDLLLSSEGTFIVNYCSMKISEAMSADLIWLVKLNNSDKNHYSMEIREIGETGCIHFFYNLWFYITAFAISRLLLCCYIIALRCYVMALWENGASEKWDVFLSWSVICYLKFYHNTVSQRVEKSRWCPGLVELYPSEE